MVRRVVVLTLVLSSIAHLGCSGTRPSVRGQSPEPGVDAGMIPPDRAAPPTGSAKGAAGRSSATMSRPRARGKVAGRLRRKISRNLEPVWDATKRSLAMGGYLAFFGSLWYLDATYGVEDDAYSPGLD